MTTLSIPVDDAVASRIREKSAAAGVTPEEYVAAVVRRLAGVDTLAEIARENEKRLRALGYETEADVEQMIREGIEEVRAEKRTR